MGGAVSAVDVGKLPPTQYLLMATLAARYRLGETYWTFPDQCLPAARNLEAKGLITTRSGPAQHAFEAQFTDAGLAMAMPPGSGYVPPFAAPIERVRRLCEAAQEGGADLMRLAPSQVLAALDGRPR